MAFLIDPKRRHTFKYAEDDISFSVTFEFTCAEDMDLSEIKKRLGDLNTDKKDDEVEQNKATNFMFYNLRKALVECEDINHHETNEPIEIKSPDGSINVENQKGVFEAIRSLMCVVTPEIKDEEGNVTQEEKKEPFINRVITAYIGAKGKNSKPGATQQ